MTRNEKPIALSRRNLLLGASAMALTTTSAIAKRVAKLSTPIVRTRAGDVSGYIDHDIVVFKGIPYGEDTAKTRFMAPQPAKPWSGVLQCIELGPRAPQPPDRGSQLHNPQLDTPIGEDCLKLNVWTPALDHRKRPVMVWIHGGGYINHSANSLVYDGVRLCTRGDVVFVNMNHRLNAFGYLYLAELGGEKYADSGNVGMLDLILALQWVRDNIAEFGGDPNNVMIFGQSGGGAKCSVLMAMPAARGLFHKVWTMSGQQVTVTPKEMATANAKQVLGTLSLDQLQSLPMSELIKLSSRSSYYGPVLDGIHIPRHPFEPDATPLSRDIPLVMGNTREETTTLIGASDPETFNLAWEQLPQKIDRHIATFIRPHTANDVVDQYRKWYPTYTPTQIFFAATTAGRSWRAQFVQAERRAAQPKDAAPTWVYQYDWQSPVDGGKWRAPHMGDIPMVLDNVAYGVGFTGGGYEAQRMADVMCNSAIAFARTGNPNAKGLPHWPAYALDKRATMMFDLPPHVQNDPRGDERRYFGALPYRQPGT